MNEEALSLLKHESLSEPLHYQLTLFIHEGERLWRQIYHDIEQLKIDFQLVKPEELNEKSLIKMEEKILYLKEQLQEYLECIDKALSIIWQTNRTDLIDKMGILKETFPPSAV